MTSTIRDPDQLEAALSQVFHLLCLSAENPGSITLENLGGLLRDASVERFRHGDYGAAEMLDALAVQAEDND